VILAALFELAITACASDHQSDADQIPIARISCVTIDALVAKFGGALDTALFARSATPGPNPTRPYPECPADETELRLTDGLYLAQSAWWLVFDEYPVSNGVGLAGANSVCSQCCYFALPLMELSSDSSGLAAIQRNGRPPAVHC